MQKATIVVMDEVDLSEIIRRVIREEIKSLLSETPKRDDDDTLLSRKEVTSLLQISLATLYNYQKNGKIPYCKIGRTVLFKKGEVMKAIEVTPRYKRRY